MLQADPLPLRLAQVWVEHYSGVLTKVGFKRLLSSPVAFYHFERDFV